MKVSRMQSVQTSVVIPVFRASETLSELTARIVATLEKMSSHFEIVFVEDGGGDDSWLLIMELASKDSRLRGIRLSRNYGQHNAILCGVRAARGNVIVTIDDDLQNPPEEIPKLIANLNRGHDVVYGFPASQRHGFIRNSASRLTKLALTSAMGAKTAAYASSFRAFKSTLRDSFLDYHGPDVNLEVLLTWGTSNFSHVFVEHEERRAGKSGYNFRRLVLHAINMATGFSTLPLRFASILGLALSLAGFLILVYVVLQFLTAEVTVPGFSFLASVISIFAGAQLFSLGIIGEYIARIHSRSMERPAYTIGETVN